MLYRFLITHHNSYVNVSLAHDFFLFGINFIAHWFFIISSGLTCRKRWNDERNVCYVFRAVFRVTHVSTLARGKKRQICECVGADKERKLNSRENVWHIFEIHFSARNKIESRRVSYYDDHKISSPRLSSFQFYEENMNNSKNLFYCILENLFFYVYSRAFS